MSVQFMVYTDEAKKWLIQYYAMRLHELLNGPTEGLPELTVLVNGENITAALVQFLGDDSGLVVYVNVSGRYYGAVVMRKGDWYLPVVPPREVSDEVLGLADAYAQVDMHNYLLSRA